MCGRYSITTNVEAMRRLFAFLERPNLPPRFNVAPTQEAPIVRMGDDARRHLPLLRWGLIPSWAKDRSIGHQMINARAESVAERPAYRTAFRKRRCLVPADGFYEWRKTAGGKQPYRIAMADGGPFAFAGLWEWWRGDGDGPVESFTIIVTAPNETVRPIHDRMPAIIDPADYDAWLSAADATIPLALLQPYPAERMTAYPVSPRVNSPRNDDPEIIAPLAGA